MTRAKMTVFIVFTLMVRAGNQRTHIAQYVEITRALYTLECFR